MYYFTPLFDRITQISLSKEVHREKNIQLYMMHLVVKKLHNNLENVITKHGGVKILYYKTLVS